MKVFLLLLSFCLWFSPSVSAAEEPRAGIEATVNSLLSILYGSGGSSSVAAREKAVRKAIEKRYSFDVVVQRALGTNRRRVSARELKQIIGLTTDLMIRTYSKRFAAASRPRVTYGRMRQIGRGRVEVVSKASIGGADYEVVYRMAKTSSGWQISDLVIEGVSLVANYRKQFDQHFARGGSAKQLIARLRNQITSSR
jgi:phospholipid transport system substrate-binding protein